MVRKWTKPRRRGLGTGARAGRHAMFKKQRGYFRRSGYYGRYNGQNLESKFFDLDLDDSVIASTGLVLDSINEIAQGTAENQRIGRKATITKIQWRYNILLSNTQNEADTADIVRVIMYLDKQCNGVTAALLDVLETADYQSFLNLANSQRFRILMDKTIPINCTTGSYNGTTDQFGK